MAWLPNGQYQNLSHRVKDGTSCFLASKIPLVDGELRSPVQMPKSDDLSPKNQKPIALGFQCCRF
ncbi:unnamed protein product [Brassica rapa subsp. narinosa]|uniref:(rape) hypothetical protein n=1 Tax=Brassica napus TaxID=3708 RepID=A0A816XCX7_BRANA|nr:unnamed protein product [Brassica napus]